MDMLSTRSLPYRGLLAGLGGVGVAFAALRLFSADVYDIVIVRMTARWYGTVFQRLTFGARVLDVGIGTGSALIRNKELLLERRLSIVGLDYEAAYVRKAEAVLREAGLWQPAPDGTNGYRRGEYYCRAVEGSIYDPKLSDLCYDEAHPRKDDGSEVPQELRFDAAYFSGSLTVMPDPPAALRAVLPVLKDGGLVFITQTFQRRHSPLLAFIKPLLKHITTIDFGQLTTEGRIDQIISDAGAFDVLENSPIPGSVDNRWQTARVIVLKAK